MRTRTRAWTWTLNNYTSKELNHIVKKMEAVYWCFGFEECPKTGTPHLQGYSYFKNEREMTYLKKLIPRAHIERSYGSPLQNKKYCSKEGNFYEFGDMPSQGHRTDMDELQETIKSGATLREIDEKHFTLFARYSKGIKESMALKLTEREDKPRVIWLHGPTGCGKTKKVYDEFDRRDVYPKEDHKWWDRYTQQKVILLDDFSALMEIKTLLRLLDRYPMVVETKGGFVDINSPYIVITCDYPPEKLYKHYKGHQLAQVLRRIDEIHEIKYDEDILWSIEKNELLEDVEST